MVVSRFESSRSSSSVSTGRFWASSTSSSTRRPAAARVEQEAVEPVEQLGARALAGQPELAVDGLEQLEPGQARVEQIGDLGIGSDPLEQRAAQRGLARPDLARDRDEALALLDAVEQVRERLAVRGGQEQEARVGCERERLLSQPVMPCVH